MLFKRQHQWILIFWTLIIMFCLQCYARIYVYDLKSNYRKYDTTIMFPYKFGSRWPLEGHLGKTVVADPEDGCSSLKPPPNATNINEFGKWFVLMKIGGCNITVKARNAQNATYDFAIIYKDGDWLSYNADILPDNITEYSDIKINAVLTLSYHADKIKRAFLYDKNVFFHITPGKDYCYNGPQYEKGMVTNSTNCSEGKETLINGEDID